tara:strand:+ start:143 stop:1675 length:1533 start_codon:yes stop_codon:yes gene_type:complete
MQTLFKSNLFSKSSSKVGAKNFLSGGKKLGSSIVGAARNNIIGFNRTAKAMVPQKKEEKESSFIKNYTNFFGSKKTEKILRKNLKLVRDSLVNTFEIARHLKAVIVDISKGLKGIDGKGGGGLFGGMIKSFLGGLFGGALIAALPVLLKIAAGIAAVGLVTFLLKLFEDEDFRDGVFKFIKSSAKIIWGIIYPGAKALFLGKFVNDDGSLNWQDGDTPKKLVDENLEKFGPEQTLEMLRAEYNKQKESGYLDSFPAKLQGIENEFFAQMGRVEAKLARKEGTIVLEKIWTREKKVRTDKIRNERKNTQEWEDIQNMEKGEERGELIKAYNKETNQMIKDLTKEIDEKYKQILIKGSTGGTIHESISGKGKKWEGSSIFDKPASPPSTSSDSNSEVDGVKSSSTGILGPISSNNDEMVNTSQNQNIAGVKSDINSLDFSKFYGNLSNGESIFNLEPFTFDLSQGQDSSGSGGITNTSGGTTSSGNAVTFYSSSNSDPTYHKLNALMTFNII